MESLYEIEKHAEYKRREYEELAEIERLAKLSHQAKKINKEKARKQEKSRQLAYLFTANLSILFVGMGLFPLLPVYAGSFGASPGMVGVYLALVYISISLGSMLTGWLAGKVAHKMLLVSAGLLGAGALALMGRASSFWEIVFLTGTVWFTGGIGLASLSVLTSWHASEEVRGKWFTVISLATPLGAIAGGLVIGRVLEWSGYPAMFAVLAGVYTAWPVLGLLFLDGKPAAAKAASGVTRAAPTRPAASFRMLLIAALLAAATVSVIRIGISLSMGAKEFSPSAIAETNVIAGLITIPLVFWLGTLSDRSGRKFFLSLGYLSAAIGGLALILSSHLWHYWLITTLILVARTISTSMSSAIAADILDPESVGRRLPQLNTIQWVAGVIGFAGSGFVIEAVGHAGLYGIAVVLSLAAAVLVGLLPLSSSPAGRPDWAVRRMAVPEEVHC